MKVCPVCNKKDYDPRTGCSDADLVEHQYAAMRWDLNEWRRLDAEEGINPEPFLTICGCGGITGDLNGGADLERELDRKHQSSKKHRDYVRRLQEWVEEHREMIP
jgi:hypothetical protein